MRVDVGFVLRLEAEIQSTSGATLGTASSVTLTNYATGTVRYWNGTAWQAGVVTLSTPRNLTVPSDWAGLEVGASYTFTSLPNLTDSFEVASPSSGSGSYHADVT